MPIPLQAEVLYGPVASRRYGRSLGVNPFPGDRKVCSMDCAYCQYGHQRPQGWRDRAELPATADLAIAFESRFLELKALDQVPDRITIAGNGEPTWHPEFHVWAYALADARDRHFGPAVKIGLLTNGRHLLRPTVLEAVRDCIDEPSVKLEVGTPQAYEAMYGVPGGGLERTMAGLRQLDRFTVQALFVRGPRFDNTAEAEFSRWLDRLDELRPRIDRVEMFTIDRPPPEEERLQAIPAEELRDLAARVRTHGFRVDVSV